MKLRAALGAALAAVLLCLAGPARADTEAIALDYGVGAGCPDRKQFVARVRTFTSKAAIVDDDGAPRRKFGIQVTRAGSAVRGELTIDDRGAKTTRHVSGATCDEVISALALATAIAVDPDALGGALPDEQNNPTTTEPPPTPPRAATPARPHRVEESKRPIPTTPEAPHVPVLYLSGGGRVGSAISPFPKLDITGELGCTAFAPFEFYVGAAYGPPQHDDTFRLEDWIGWLGVGYRLLELEPFSVLALAAIEGGEVRAGGGPNVIPARSLHAPWVAVNVGLAARVEATGPLFFQANVGARAPILLQLYNETDDKGLRPLFEVERLGYLLGISAGIHFL